MVLLMGCNICFKGVIWKIIPNLSLLPLLIWSTVVSYVALNECLLLKERTCSSRSNFFFLVRTSCPVKHTGSKKPFPFENMAEKHMLWPSSRLPHLLLPSCCDPSLDTASSHPVSPCCDFPSKLPLTASMFLP